MLAQFVILAAALSSITSGSQKRLDVYTRHTVGLIIREDSLDSVNSDNYLKVVLSGYYEEAKKMWCRRTVRITGASKVIEDLEEKTKPNLEKEINEYKRKCPLSIESLLISTRYVEIKKRSTKAAIWIIKGKTLDLCRGRGKGSKNGLRLSLHLNKIEYEKACLSFDVIEPIKINFLLLTWQDECRVDGVLTLALDPKGYFFSEDGGWCKSPLDWRPKKVLVDTLGDFFGEMIIFGFRESCSSPTP